MRELEVIVAGERSRERDGVREEGEAACVRREKERERLNVLG